MSRRSAFTHAGALFLALTLVLQASSAGAAATPLWSSSLAFTNVVASKPVQGGGYPVEPGTNAYVPGTCGPQQLDSNRSESWIAVKPGTEDLIGTSKFFISKWSTFYDFHLGSYTILGGTPVANNQVQGYECTTVGTQAMPPSWTMNTDPNVDFDTKGRAYQTTLPFNAFWQNMHPNAAVMVSYTDDLGAHWVTANGGEPLEQSPNSSSLQFGHVEDKQWIAVNHIPGNKYQDHVYAMWSVFNGSSVDLRLSVSRDRGATFSRYSSFTTPAVSGPANFYVYPSIDANGDLYVSFASQEKDLHGGVVSLYVAKSTDDGATFTFSRVVTGVGVIPSCCLPNTTFRDGITESFAASPTYPGHLYATYEDWDFTNGQMDVKFVQSTNGGATWSAPVKVNDNAESAGYTDQFQPSIAAGPNGAVAIAFYDRRAACPNDKSVLAADVGRRNFCIDVTLQAYKDTGAGAQPVLANTRITKYTWDPMNPAQHVDGIGQMACAAHRDPCTQRAFIGDYFGLAISGGNIYALFVSTHYPSSVSADEGGPVYYQQQVLATVPRSAYGAGY
ncbi:MAG TPA: sialidase family protein [Candidatus Limnocylindria bacterium]|nr:sialidase family protein [Candidatus Limnocylindria bacterium]